MSIEALDRAKILIVDDVPTNVVILGNALADAYEVRFATSGQEAIALVNEAVPDLILLDVMMPGMSGHDVHRYLRQHAQFRDVAVIFVTADASLDSELEGLQLGAEDYLTKPIVVPILQARVKNVLERHRRCQDLGLSLSSAEQGLWEWQTTQELVKFNDNWAIPLGYARDEMRPCVMTWQHIVHPNDWPLLFAARDAYFNCVSGLFDPEIRMRQKDDTFVWMQLHGKGVEFDEQLRPLKMMGTYMNISRRKHAELELRKRETQLATMIASLQDAVLVLDQVGHITICHVPANSQLAFLEGALVGEPYAGTLPPALVVQIDAAINEARAVGRTSQTEFELCLDDSRRYLHLTVNALAGSDLSPTGYLVVVHDVTQRKQAEEEIRALAFFDPLTKLPNQRMLRDRLRLALAASVRNRRAGALMFLDIDNFRRMEQGQGHSVGDQLLLETARRIALCIDERGTVARLGGDKFLVLLENLGDNDREAANSVGRIGEEILACVNQPMRVVEGEYHLTPSIGIVIFDGQEHGEEVLLQQVELAMYSAKAAGGNQLKFFDPEMQTNALTYVALEQAIYKGLHGGHFFLLYQPQVDGGGRIVGAEALVRWRHPERGVLAPGHFIPLAEDTGLIVPLGQYIMEVACRQLYRWQHQPLTAHLSLAVNVSSRQFEKPTFVEEVELLVQTTAINPRYLKLEITESLLLGNTDSIILKMQRLRELGISLSMDDFGTGYSSLAYLKHLPLDQLKIDQTFVRNALSSRVDAAIIRSIMTLGNSLGISVIAEGVETAAEWHFLREEGCSNFQGYHFGRPCSVEDLEALLLRDGAQGRLC